jgi:glycine oxidase
VPDDLSVDNRALLAALQVAAEKAGVVFDRRAARAVTGDPVSRVECVEGPPVEADVVLVAAGAYSSSLHPALDGLVRPVKGEILRLARRPGAFPVPTRTVRALVDGHPVYLVPRDDPAGLVVGATQSENGFDTEPTVGGVRDLLRDAERIVPGIAEYALLEVAAGLRPGSPDNVPLIGPVGQGLLVATGHSRNGILLAPITAAAVVASLRGERVPTVVEAADPGRFARSRR